MTYQVEELSTMVNALAGSNVFTSKMIDTHGELLRQHVLKNVIDVVGEDLYEGYLLDEVGQGLLYEAMSDKSEEFIKETWKNYVDLGLTPKQVYKASSEAIRLLKFMDKEWNFMVTFISVCFNLQTKLSEQ